MADRKGPEQLAATSIGRDSTICKVHGCAVLGTAYGDTRTSGLGSRRSRKLTLGLGAHR